jgi:hypothetical protein
MDISDLKLKGDPSDILYQQRWSFDRLHAFDLDSLYNEISAAFDKILIDHTPRNGFGFANYEVLAYRGHLRDRMPLGFDLTGSFKLGSTNRHILGKFYEGLRDLFSEVKDELVNNPGQLKLEVFVTGFND